MEYNEKHPEPAYHCGALVAVYGAIQNRAMPDVDASLIDRYYASAIQTPALVLGQLSRMSNYHIGKIDSYWWEQELTGLRDQVACAIGDDIPTALHPEQQSYFALGYYQMCANLNKMEKVEAVNLISTLRQSIQSSSDANEDYAKEFADIPLVGRTIFEQQRLLYNALLEWLNQFERQFSQK